MLRKPEWTLLIALKEYCMLQCIMGYNTIFLPLLTPSHKQQSPSHKGKRQQQELISELRKRQGKDSRHVYEGKDGAIEDIITGKSRPDNNLNLFAFALKKLIMSICAFLLVTDAVLLDALRFFLNLCL